MSEPLQTQELMLIEQRVANEGPSLVVAYLLWLFLFFFSGHRFYLGRPRSAVLQMLSLLLVFGFFWWFLDLFAIPGMVAERRQALRERLLSARPRVMSNVPLPVLAEPATVTTELETLWKLKEVGALSEEEFAAQKAKLLEPRWTCLGKVGSSR